MVTVMSPAEQRVLLSNIDWGLYEELITAHRDQSVPRLTYDQGRLEIMSPSPEHEQLKETVTLLVNVVAEEMGINAEGYGSTTFRREDLARGFEPDASFYITNLERVKGRAELDLRTDPPPDLVIEIDITHPSLPKFPIFAHLGVPEVWLCDGRALRIFRLEGEDYVEGTESASLPGLTAEAISQLLGESRTQQRLVWLRRVRERVRELRL